MEKAGKFYKCFSKVGGNFSFLKNVEFLEFFGFTLCFRTFQAKIFFFKIFQTDRKISLPIHVVFPWDLEKLQYTRVNILDLKILQVFFQK